MLNFAIWLTFLDFMDDQKKGDKMKKVPKKGWIKWL
jgi:hypothetical protein